jgi:hypothetical protein
MTENNRTISEGSFLMTIVRIRMAIGLLGEKGNANWWPSLWCGPSATAFLSPIYGERTDAARYHGVVEAARRVHDNRIGVGRAFHLFRLPETLERRLHDAVTQHDAISTMGAIATKEDAEALLYDIAGEVEPRVGPVRIGAISDLAAPNWHKALVAHYLAAFKSTQQSFPYFAEGL